MRYDYHEKKRHYGSMQGSYRVVMDTSSESISKQRDRSSELAKPSHRRVVCFSSTLPLQLLHL